MTAVPPQRNKVTTIEEVPEIILAGGVILGTWNEISEAIQEIEMVTLCT